VKDAAKEWLNGLAAEVYDEGIQKLVTREISSSHGGEYDAQSCLLGYTALEKYFIPTVEGLRTT
jgi:hypothetical protein